MKIGIFGTGVVGQTIAEKMKELGHDVMVGTRSKEQLMARSEPDSFGRPPFRDWQQSHREIQLGTLSEAAAFGELLVNAMNGNGAVQALGAVAENDLDDKVLLDIANPLDFSNGYPPSLTVCNTDSLGEQIQKSFPGLKVVKSLNTMTAYLMVNPRLIPEDQTVFVSGNDQDAKSVVRQILISFGWKESEILDLGDITTARGSEQLLPIWVRIYGGIGNPMFNFRIVFGQNPVA